jgi:hypothetical protein
MKSKLYEATPIILFPEAIAVPKDVRKGPNFVRLSVCVAPRCVRQDSCDTCRRQKSSTISPVSSIPSSSGMGPML